MDEQGRVYRVVSATGQAKGEAPHRLTLVIERIGDGARSLATSYGLTRREAHIAELLSRRATNGEIAEELGISRHTARHHTERVMAKLGVTSRAAVREKLFAIATESLEEEER